MEKIKDGQGNCELHQVTRGDNEEADFLGKMAATGEQHMTQSFLFEELHTPAMDVEEYFSKEEGES